MHLVPEGSRLDTARRGVQQAGETIHTKLKYRFGVRTQPATRRESSTHPIDESVCFGEERVPCFVGDVVAFHVWSPGEQRM
jgi:hypothetical protein